MHAAFFQKCFGKNVGRPDGNDHHLVPAELVPKGIVIDQCGIIFVKHSLDGSVHSHFWDLKNKRGDEEKHGGEGFYPVPVQKAGERFEIVFDLFPCVSHIIRIRLFTGTVSISASVQDDTCSMKSSINQLRMYRCLSGPET